MSPLALKDGERFLLIGDSITDCGRREECAPHGCGYAAMIQGLVCAVAPQLRIEYLNRGIGGNTVVDLEARWEEDCVALKPDWLSVLIGINDCHSYLSEGVAALGPEPYAERMEALLDRAVQATGCRLVLLEPFYFALPPGADDFQRRVLSVLPDYIAAVHRLAQQFAARLVRIHDLGQRVLGARAQAGLEVDNLLAAEPVHPNLVGHALLAQALLAALGEP